MASEIGVERRDLENANIVFENTRGSDDVIGGHRRQLTIFKARGSIP